MTTDITPFAAADQTPVAQTADPTGGRLTAWAGSLRAAHDIGAALCGTQFAPDAYRGKPEEAAAAILYGDEIGLSPTQALQSVIIVKGRPGMYARAMVALVLSRGHDVWTEETTPTKVVVCGRRRGGTHTERSEWTTDRARKAGYTSNRKYETDPQAMLYARAASEVCRRIAPDALAGLAYSVEEIELDEPPVTATVTRTAGRTGTGGKVTRSRGKRASAPTPPEPEIDDTPSDPAPDPITDAQRGKLHALFGEVGITDADGQRQWIADTLHRAPSSRADLTKADAATLIDALERLAAPAPTEEVVDGEVVDEEPPADLWAQEDAEAAGR